jgi:hypothetical protein
MDQETFVAAIDLAAERCKIDGLGQYCLGVLAEIRNRLVIGDQPTCQPQDFDIATSLMLKPAARLDPIEIAGTTAGR